MPKDTAAPKAPAVAETAEKTAEPRNVSVEVLTPGTKIGKAICGCGPCSFPLTMSDAKALEAMGKVTIRGLF